MANKYVITGGGNWSGSIWNTASNQATSNTTPPRTTDAAYLDAYSGPVTVDTTTCVCQSLQATNYANTLTFTAGQKLTSSGTVLIGAGATIAGTGTLQMNSSNINIVPVFTGDFIMATTGAKGLQADLTVNGMFSVTGTSAFTGSAYKIYAQGGYSGGTGSSGQYWSSSSGCPALYLQGGTITGTIGGASGNIYLDGNITFATGTTYQTDIRTSGTVQWLSGTTTHTNSITRLISFTGTLNIGNNVQWNTIQFTSVTCTLAADLYMNNFLTITGSPTINGSGYKVYVTNDVICYGVGTYAGTFDGIYLTGTGTFGSNTTPSGAQLDSTFTVSCNVNINSSGTVTFKDKTIYFGGIKTLTYVAGTVSASGATFSLLNGNYFFDINNAFLIPTLTINSVNYCGIVSDLTIGNLVLVPGSTLAIYNTKTLTITSSVAINGSRDSVVTFYEQSGTGLAYLTYQGTAANIEIFEAEISRINASGSSVPIVTWYGYKSATCVNVFARTLVDIGGGGVSVTHY